MVADEVNQTAKPDFGQKLVFVSLVASLGDYFGYSTEGLLFPDSANKNDP